MKFNPLNVPTHWQNYWTRFPEGHTILEALISWVSQVDDMVVNQNNLNTTVETYGQRLDDFLDLFDTNLRDTAEETLKDWQTSGFLNVVINAALQWQLDDYITTNEQDKVSTNQQLQQKADRSQIGSPLTTTNMSGMTDNTKVYVNTTDGKWYSWNGSEWVAGGTYNSQGIGNGTVTNSKIASVEHQKIDSKLLARTKSKNLFDKEAVTVGFFVNHANGELNVHSSGTQTASEYILIEPNSDYTMSNANVLAFYDDDYKYVSGINIDDQENAHTFTTPINARYIRISTRTPYLDTQQLEKGNTATSYVPYEEYFSRKNIIKNHNVADGEISESKLNFKPAVLSKGKNLFDKSKVTYGYFVNYTNGELNVHSPGTQTTSEYILIEPNTDYTMSSTNVHAFYDDEYKYVSGINIDDQENAHTFTTPINARYIRLSTRTPYLDTQQLEKGNTKTEYEPYYVGIKGVSFPTEVSANNPLIGKSINFNGDSLTAATYGWANKIAVRNSMDFENYAVSGATIVYKERDNGTPRHCISQSVREMRTGADYIILSGGFNDSHLGTDMGVITPDYTSEFDENTFCGAFESMLKYVYQTYPGKKIGFIITHKVPGTFSPYGGRDDEYYNFNNFRLKIIEMLEKWSVPYFDLYTDSGLPMNVPQIAAAFYPDGTHPNEAGYRVWADKIEPWLKTL